MFNDMFTRCYNKSENKIRSTILNCRSNVTVFWSLEALVYHLS